MVYITEDMVRRRAEHNECEIFSLEEVSLHQQDIERIQHIERWCRDLRILYLQNNLIPRIENVGRLKKLEYLNLALNNIEVIENLEGCESLQKLDLTVNFVGRLSSVQSLKANVHLRELFLVGNPCTEFHGYRQYVVASLPQLQYLDGTEISRSERIRSLQGLEEVKRRVQQQEEEYMRRRQKEREEQNQMDQQNQVDQLNLTDQQNQVDQLNQMDQQNQVDQQNRMDQEAEFWQTPCSFTPESRLEVHRFMQEKKKTRQRDGEKTPKTPRTLITADGRVLNVNQPKLDFLLTEDDDNNSIILDLAVFRHMDTSLIEVDVQPTYARVSVKGKIFQVVLPAEVKPDSSTAQRSQTTGHLVLTMPRAEGEINVTTRTKAVPRPLRMPQNQPGSSSDSPEDDKRRTAGPEKLEVDPSRRTSVDLANIVPRRVANAGPLETQSQTSLSGVCGGFEDDPDVPPLI
ncbi:dynein axonemal assembly factor 11 [Sphaeramia orbicularis]|uniref:dynein axonemal assembly factor 11 n=1 Tax=Sphaeramia orbicularis TaxID=375764 RepID=UPI00118035AF|nr:protein tilB homolog [Sphaeramia orbicularis]